MPREQLAQGAQIHGQRLCAGRFAGCGSVPLRIVGGHRCCRRQTYQLRHCHGDGAGAAPSALLPVVFAAQGARRALSVGTIVVLEGEYCYTPDMPGQIAVADLDPPVTFVNPSDKSAPQCQIVAVLVLQLFAEAV